VASRSIADEIRNELSALSLDEETKGAIDGWLAADREFNTWFLVTTKRALADDELMDLLEGYRESQEMMSEAWSTFGDDRDGSRLEAAIAISITKMHALMNK
jgi:hypothetical protein